MKGVRGEPTWRVMFIAKWLQILSSCRTSVHRGTYAFIDLKLAFKRQSCNLFSKEHESILISFSFILLYVRRILPGPILKHFL